PGGADALRANFYALRSSFLLGAVIREGAIHIDQVDAGLGLEPGPVEHDEIGVLAALDGTDAIGDARDLRGVDRQPFERFLVRQSVTDRHRATVAEPLALDNWIVRVKRVGHARFPQRVRAAHDVFLHADAHEE